MKQLTPEQQDRIALHLNTLIQKRQAIPQDVYVMFRGRSHILYSVTYHNRRIYGELAVAGQGILFEVALTKAEAANIALEVLAQAEAEVCTICQTWVATHTEQVGDITYHVCDKPKCQDAVRHIRVVERPEPDYVESMRGPMYSYYIPDGRVREALLACSYSVEPQYRTLTIDEQGRVSGWYKVNLKLERGEQVELPDGTTVRYEGTDLTFVRQCTGGAL